MQMFCHDCGQVHKFIACPLGVAKDNTMRVELVKDLELSIEQYKQV